MAAICVFCGSRNGANPAYAEAARSFGSELARRGHTLVYGGGNIGLMGVVADAALAGGASVVGVMPTLLVEREIAHAGLDTMVSTPGMHERKAQMHARSDAYVSLPGGYGTIEEFSEVISWRQIGIHRKPVGFLNTNGYYDPFLVMLRAMASEGFLDDPSIDELVVEPTGGTLLDRLF